MQQAPSFDGLMFGPFPLRKDGLAAPEVEVGRGRVVEALVVAVAVVMFDKGLDLALEVSGHKEVLRRQATPFDFSLQILPDGDSSQSSSKGRPT
jgi:hypothetical protein